MVRLFICVLLMALPQLSQAKAFTLYLVRHAEKQVDKGSDPGLTDCGKQRASQLAKMLASVTLDAVYSTNTSRTIATAQPVANQLGLAITAYHGRALDELVSLLLKRQQNALIVGHSNTTAEVAAKLLNTSLPTIEEHEYSLLYQLTLDTEKPATDSRLTLLHQPLSCH
jgi:broad specificity phosphatase PhoE